MSAQNVMLDTTNPEGKWVFRMGGIASLAIGVAYIVIIVLFVSAGEPPVGGEARLDYFVGKTTIWWSIVGLSVLTNFLFVPVALSLYFALKDVNRVAMLLGVAFVGLFVILENAVSWTTHGALILLSEGYATAINETQRAIFIAAATFASAVLESPLAAVWAIGTISFGYLIIGFVMLKSAFSKITAYLGIITGIFGMIAVMGMDIAVYLHSFAALLWLFFVGYRLYRLSQSPLG